MNLVNELQVSTETDDVLTVLRKAQRLASKLNRLDIADWLTSERDGYFGKDAVPQYRKVRARLAINTNGYIPAGFGFVMKGIQDLPQLRFNPELDFKESISQVCQLIVSSDAGNCIYSPVEEGTDEAIAIRSYVRLNPNLEKQVSFLLHLNETQIRAIPEQVKDRVLKWACDLEAAGVTGQGITFSAHEKQIASTVIFNIDRSSIGQLSNTGTNHRGAK